MADFSLILGPFVFRDFEVPSEIKFGAEQSMEIHKLVGGGRVVDTMGPDPKPIRWKGHLRGRNASSRARQLELMCNSGATFPVSFGSFFYLVVVRSVSFDFQRYYEIPYDIELEHATAPLSSVIGGLTAMVRADLSSLSGLGGLL